MRFLRTAPTRRLLTLIAAAVMVGATGAAIAVAATAGGPVPRRTALANAIHRALVAKAPSGISARISFTDNLINTSEIQGSGPLLTGATGRLWATAGHLRLELQSANGDTQLVIDQGAFWLSDPSSNTVYEGKLPADSGKAASGKHGDRAGAPPSIAEIQSDLSKLAAHLHLSGAEPTDVAGQAAYQVRVSPSKPGGLLGAVQLAWDAARGIPLDVGLYARGDSTPVLELKATGISFGKVPLSDFAVTPPAGATVEKLSGASPASGRAVKPLGFTVVAPSRAAGLGLTAKRRLGRSELLSYGSGLGAVEVLERPASSDSTGAPDQTGGDDGSGLSIPTVSIDGVSAHLLATEIGTLLQFERLGVSYVVVGSVPAGTAEAVARGL